MPAVNYYVGLYHSLNENIESFLQTYSLLLLLMLLSFRDIKAFKNCHCVIIVNLFSLAFRNSQVFVFPLFSYHQAVNSLLTLSVWRYQLQVHFVLLINLKSPTNP